MFSYVGFALVTYLVFSADFFLLLAKSSRMWPWQDLPVQQAQTMNCADFQGPK